MRLEIRVLSSTMAAIRSTLDEIRSSGLFSALMPLGSGRGLGAPAGDGGDSGGSLLRSMTG
jgi:hypothetical protein